VEKEREEKGIVRREKRKERVQLKVGEVAQIGNSIVEARRAEELSTTPAGRVAKHEAAHVFVAEETGTSSVMATIIGDGEADGKSLLSGFNEAAFGAGEASGTGGAGYDLWAIARNGGSPMRGVMMAEAVMSGEDDVLGSLGSELQDSKTMHGGEIRDVIARAKRNRVEALAIIKNPLGERQYITKLHNGMIDILVAVPLKPPMPGPASLN